MPWEKVLWATLIAFMAYRWRPQAWDEDCLLVLVEAEDTLSHRYRMKKLGNVRSIFKVDRNLDFHLRIDDEAAAEAKQKWNFIILTKHFAEEKDSRRFGDSLRSHDFIKSFSTFPIKSKTIRGQLAYYALHLKGLIGTYIPSYQATFSEVGNARQDKVMSDEEGVMEELCSDEKALNETQIMVNIIKVKDQEELTKYALAVVWNMFPTLESRMIVTGDSKSDYWDHVTLVKYKTRAAMCKMVTSKEFAAVVGHKVNGIGDAHTYLTRQIFGK